MKRRSGLLLGAALVAGLLCGCTKRDAGVVQAAPYAAPTLGEVWGQSLRALPDWSGNWLPTGCDRPGTAGAVPGMDRGPMQLLIAPEQTLIVWEGVDLVRRIHTDGRGHPPPAALASAPVGHSTGRWEGAVLQVDTVLPAAGGTLQVSERMHLDAPDRLVIDTRVEPGAVALSRVYRLAAPGERLDCTASRGAIAR